MGDGSMSIREFARRGGKASAAKRTADERRDQAALGGRVTADKHWPEQHSQMGKKRSENPTPRFTGKTVERAIVARAVAEHEQEQQERREREQDVSDVA